MNNTEKKRLQSQRGEKRLRKDLEMKKILLPAIMICIATLFIAAIPTEAEYAIYDDTIRLHILANSDTEEDQILKLQLRDAVLTEYGEELSVFESAKDAAARLSEKTEEIKHFCDNKLNELGSDYTTEVTLTEEWYDTREYESFTLPKGYYISLRIMIGEADGKNWWCVMFPPLCLDAAVTENVYTKEEEFLVTKKYSVKFKIVELISELTK